MKISTIEAYPVSVPFKKDLVIVNALGVHVASHYVVVTIRTEDGLTGLGEATGSPTWSGETQDGMLSVIRHVLSPLLIGGDPLQVNSLADTMDRAIIGNPFAKASLEMALLDLVGKCAQVPVHVLLGGRRRSPKIPLKFVIGANQPSEAARLAEAYAVKGFRAFKVKVGLEWSTDIARVQAVRSALGDEFRISVDANGGWSERETLSAIPQLERLNVNALEQPLCRKELRACARIRQRTAIPIILDESILTREDALEAIRYDACDLISVYPGKNGGILRSVEIAQLAAAAGLDCVVGCNLEGEIGSSAMLHLAVSVPNLAKCVDHDIIGPLFHDRSFAIRPIAIENGCAVLAEGTGLGVEVDLGSIKGQKNVTPIGG